MTNRIQLPKSPKAFRRRSWHDYDELGNDEEHIIPERESISDDDRTEDNKKDKDKKTKNKSDSKEKSKKDKKEKNKSKKNNKGKIDWCSGDGGLVDSENKLEDNTEEDTETNVRSTCSDEQPILFEPLDSVGLMSKVTISVQKAD